MPGRRIPVANLTREDGLDFLSDVPRVRIVTKTPDRAGLLMRQGALPHC